MDEWLSLAEAAREYGLSTHALRRRVRAGKVQHRTVEGPHGPTYEIKLDGEMPRSRTERTVAPCGPDRTVTQSSRSAPALAPLVEALRKAQAETLAHAAAAGLWQGRCEALEAKVRELEGQLALPAPTARRRRWWWPWG